MLKKFINCILFVSTILPTYFFQIGYCASQNPEDFIREFYRWYIEADKLKIQPEYNDTIYKYVKKETIDKIHSNNHGLYYFTQFGVSPPGDVKVDIGPSITIDNVAIVRVSFVSEKIKNRNIIVFLNKIDGRFWIVRVTDVYPCL